MNLLLALSVAVLFGAGTFLMLKHDLIRMAAGVLMISNAVTLFIMSVGLSRGQAPIYPLAEGRPISDPVVQSLTLTAIVISFGLTALLLTIIYRVYTLYGTLRGPDDATQDDHHEETAGELPSQPPRNEPPRERSRA
jgi:multicomponent Na+:H+ antiporter subunit C